MHKNRHILSALFVLFPMFLFAQGWESRIPYFRYSIGVDGGINQLYSDLEANKPIGPTARVRGAMFLIHGVELGVEAEVGLLKADNGASSLDSLRFAKNNYTKGSIGVRLYPLLFLQNNHDRRIEYRQGFGKKVLNRVYVGAGFGAIYNKQLGVHEEYSTQPPQGSGLLPEPINTKFSDQDRGFSFLTVLNAGVDIPLSSLNPNRVDFAIWSLNFNVQSNIGTAKGKDIIDGWSAPGLEEEPIGKAPDVYNVYSLGLKVAF